jgi:hypothetical protein
MSFEIADGLYQGELHLDLTEFRPNLVRLLPKVNVAMAASHPFLPFAAKLCPSSRSAKFRDSEPALGSVDFTGRRSIVSRRVGKNL